jgi:MerE protein
MAENAAPSAPVAGASKCATAFTPAQLENRGMVWVAGSFLLCPCHLPLTLALAATVLAGTAAGALLRTHAIAAGVVITLAWAAGTWRGILLFRAARRCAAGAIGQS